MIQTDIHAATHVESKDGRIERIRSKWGVNGRHLAKPSQGGFGCITESGRKISMWEAQCYYRNDVKVEANVILELTNAQFVALRSLVMDLVTGEHKDKFKDHKWEVFNAEGETVITLEDLYVLLVNR